MGCFRKKEGYVTKGNRKIGEGRTAEAAQIVMDGLNDYQNRIVSAINGYPAADAALVITALRVLADNLEEHNPDCKPLLSWIDKSVTKPVLKNTQKTEKTKPR